MAAQSPFSLDLNDYLVNDTIPRIPYRIDINIPVLMLAYLV